ncbi:hypothetical protein [Streptomyces sp. NPDC127033]|uniref:hypothetical protein n=1 Tax=Streptomyces sp. NPDC127033 TaxID=3347110 RepID=UPI0036569053
MINDQDREVARRTMGSRAQLEREQRERMAGELAEQPIPEGDTRNSAATSVWRTPSTDNTVDIRVPKQFVLTADIARAVAGDLLSAAAPAWGASTLGLVVDYLQGICQH